MFREDKVLTHGDAVSFGASVVHSWPVQIRLFDLCGLVAKEEVWNRI